MTRSLLTAAVAATALLLAVPLSALAQTQAQQHHDQDEGGSAAPPAPSTGTMQGRQQVSPSGGAQMPMMGSEEDEKDMMDCPMMAQMMRMHPEMKSQMMAMHPEMMAMMHKRMGADGRMMMEDGSGSGMMMRQGGMGLDSGVVTPIQHLSIDDVRDFFEHRLRQIGNDRLKLGNVTETDADGITVEIVTVEDSLVDRLAVDRHSGVIQRVQ